MRIMMVHNHYRSEMPSGETRVVEREANELRARGHVVDLVERHSDDIESWSPAKRATLAARVVWSQAARQELVEQLRTRRPDVVHIHNTFPLLTPSILSACTQVGVPLVVTLHNYKATCASGAFFREGRVCFECVEHSPLRAVRHSCYRDSRLATLPVVAAGAAMRQAWQRHVSAFIMISQRQRDLLAGVNLPAERVFVKHNFVPDILPAASAALALSQAPPEHAVAFLGRLDEPKGARLMMRAWDEFRRASPRSTLRLDIGGTGPLHDEVTRWAGVRADVDMLGQLNAVESARLLARSRAALVPSEWEETFGLVAVEAMATATASIAPAHGAFPEIITDGVDGRLVRPHDPGAFAEVFREIDTNPARYHELGSRARETYQRRFTAETGIARLLDVYRFAIARPVRGAGRRDRPASVSDLRVPSL